MTRIDNRVQVGSLKIGDLCTISPNGLQWRIYDAHETSIMLTANGRTKIVNTDKKVWTIQTEPTLVEKIIESVEISNTEKEIAKKHVLHHLKMLKASMGKEKKRFPGNPRNLGIDAAMLIVDSKIAKVEKL